MIFWVILLVLYGIAAFKVIEWQTISRLGFQSETPLFYLSKPFLYHWSCYFLFATAFLIPLFSEDIPWWGCIIVGIEALFIGIGGRNRSLKVYRSILQEMLSETEEMETKTKLEKELKLSDIEIWNNLKKLRA